jgi:hypothetical protein
MSLGILPRSLIAGTILVTFWRKTWMSGCTPEAAFTIKLKRRKDHPELHTAELHIEMNPNVIATDAQIAFYKRVREIDAGIRRVLFPDRAGCTPPWRWTNTKRGRTNWENCKLCHDDYMKWLKDIAKAGLGIPKPQIAFAACALDTPCWDMLTRWGQDARTRAIRSYGIALFGLELAMVLAFSLVGFIVDQADGNLAFLRVTPQRLAAYGLAMTGAAIGAWLIFVLRSLPDDWASLVAAASYTVKAWIRATYVVSFAFIAVLMLRTGMITFTFGSLKSETAFPLSASSPGSLISALLIGFLFGLADLTLPTLISRRAEDVAGRISGSGTVTPVR